MPHLERRLGLFAVITISISSMIGSGVFVLPGIGFSITGPSLFLAFILSAICILPAAMGKAELATAMPTSGGTYVYLERTFGPWIGTISGLGLFSSILLKATFALIGIGTYFTVLSDLPLIPVVLVFLLFITSLNIFGVGKVSGFLKIALSVTILALLVLAAFALPHLQVQNFTPFMPMGLKGLGSAAALVFVSFAGVTKIAAIAEEVKSPEKNLPKGILLSLLIVTVLYVGISFILAGTYNNQNIAGELRPIYRLAKDILGPTAGVIFAFIAVLTMVNTSNAGILAGSRFPFAMARDNLLPSFLGKLHPKFLTPIASIMMAGILVAILLLTLDVTKIVKLASAFKIMLYISVNFTVIILRESHLQWYKPGYKSPFYPWLQIFGVIAGLTLLISMGMMAVWAALTITIMGSIFYFLYSRKRTDRKGVVGIKGKRTDLLQTAPTLHEDGFCSFDVQGEAQVVVSLLGKERSPEMLVQMGLAMAQHKHIEVSYILEIPEQTDLHDVTEEPSDLKSLKRRVKTMADKMDESIAFDIIPSHDVSRTIFEISQSLHCKWLLLEWKGRNREGITFNNPIDWLKSHLHCHVATYKDAGIRYISRIAIFIKNDQNDVLALQTAKQLASEFSAELVVLYYQANSNYKLEFCGHVKSLVPEGTLTIILKEEDQLKSLIKISSKFDLIIHGRCQDSTLDRFLGTFNDKLMSQASCSVLEVHKAKA